MPPQEANDNRPPALPRQFRPTTPRRAARPAANDNELGPEPPVMTWGRAVPILGICVVFDLLKLFCNFLWFFGPLLAAASVYGPLANYLGSWLASMLAGLTGVAAGVSAGFIFEALGAALAMFVALIGWLTVAILLAMANPRIFDVRLGHWLWVLIGWAFSEVPFLDAAPTMTGTVGGMYYRQIKHEKAAHGAWKAQYDALVARRTSAIAEEIRYRRAYAQAANEAGAQTTAQEIPEPLPKAA